MFRQLATVGLVVLLGLAGAGTAGASGARTPGTDLIVGLTSNGGLVGPDTIYRVSVTNNGTRPVTAATVEVRLDPRARSIFPSTTGCTFDPATDKATCAFGAVAVGSAATMQAWIYFDLPPAHTYLTATAALVSSTPADELPADDSATLRCEYTNHYPGFPPYPYQIRNCRPA